MVKDEGDWRTNYQPGTMKASGYGKGTLIPITTIALTFIFSLQAQTTLTVTFDLPPTNLTQGMNYYFESGMSFAPAPPGTNFYRNWPDPFSSPSDGTAYIWGGRPWQPLRFGLTNGTAFQLISVDLGDFSFSTTTVTFVGYKQGGGTITTNFLVNWIADGPGGVADFRTFSFGPEFSGLDHVDVPTIPWVMDNVVFNIPEPSVGALCVLGALLIGRRRFSTG